MDDLTTAAFPYPCSCDDNDLVEVFERTGVCSSQLQFRHLAPKMPADEQPSIPSGMLSAGDDDVRRTE